MTFSACWAVIIGDNYTNFYLTGDNSLDRNNAMDTISFKSEDCVSIKLT